jgi:preprotein translocase subunit Sss1
VSKLNWFIQERKEPSKEKYCRVFLKKRKEPRKKEYCKIFFKKMKELNGQNIAEYINQERNDL